MCIFVLIFGMNAKKCIFRAGHFMELFLHGKLYEYVKKIFPRTYNYSIYIHIMFVLAHMCILVTGDNCLVSYVDVDVNCELWIVDCGGGAKRIALCECEVIVYVRTSTIEECQHPSSYMLAYFIISKLRLCVYFHWRASPSDFFVRRKI